MLVLLIFPSHELKSTLEKLAKKGHENAKSRGINKKEFSTINYISRCINVFFKAKAEAKLSWNHDFNSSYEVVLRSGEWNNSWIMPDHTNSSAAAHFHIAITVKEIKSDEMKANLGEFFMKVKSLEKEAKETRHSMYTLKFDVAQQLFL